MMTLLLLLVMVCMHVYLDHDTLEVWMSGHWFSSAVDGARTQRPNQYRHLARAQRVVPEAPDY